MVHPFSLNGYNIVMDIESGAVHLMDCAAYDIVSEYINGLPDDNELLNNSKLKEKYSGSELLSAVNELRELERGHMLYTKAPEYDKAYFSRLLPVKAMCLHVAHDCNLRCRYCFASQGDYHGERGIMPPETGIKAVNYLLASSEGRGNLEVDFFGGEPTLAMDTVRETVAYARSREKELNKNFRFTLTTNGLLLNDDNTDFINREMSNVVLSIDGRKSVNDNMRTCVNGSGSYDIIVPKFKRLVEKRGNKSYYVRGTFTHENLDFVKDFEHLYGLGFNEISIEPATLPSATDYAITDDDLPRIAAEYEKLAIRIAQMRKEGKKVNFFHYMIDPSGGPCAIKRLKGCGAGNEYIAVSPNGDLYPCHQFVGMEDYKIGTLDSGIERCDICEAFASSNVLTKPDCAECFAKYHCSGGCTAGNVLYGGGIDKPHKQACFMQKKRLECAVMLYAASKEQ